MVRHFEAALSRIRRSSAGKTFHTTLTSLPYLLLMSWVCAWMILAPYVVQKAQAGVLEIGNFSIKNERELGRKFNILIKSRLPLVEDPEIKGYVEDLVRDISKGMPPQPFEIETSVILHNALNAFAAPAGYMFVHSGLILNLEHESEVAGVLAHELAHVAQRHIARRIERMNAINLISLLGILAGVLLGGEYTEGMVIGSQAAAMTAMLKYSQDDEREADQVGMNYLVKSGFPPTGPIGAFKAILKKQWLGGSGIPSYLSTHPGLKERIGYLEHRVARLPKAQQKQKSDDSRFKRVQMLLRARYTDPEPALQFFKNNKQGGWLNTLGMAIVYERKNMYANAEAAYKEAYKKAKGDPLAARELGIFYFQKGEFKSASELLQQTIVMRPKDLFALFYFARIQGELGHTEQAATYLERILRRLPEDAEVHYYLGRILGQGSQYFNAHLHLAYSAIYANNQKQTRFHMDKTKRLIKTDQDQNKYDELEEVFKERQEFW